MTLPAPFVPNPAATPNDRSLNSLIGDLAAGSPEFSARWARHNVRFHRSARKTLHTPLVGDIELTGDALELPGEGLTLIASQHGRTGKPCPTTARLPHQLECKRKPADRPSVRPAPAPR